MFELSSSSNSNLVILQIIDDTLDFVSLSLLTSASTTNKSFRFLYCQSRRPWNLPSQCNRVFGIPIKTVKHSASLDWFAITYHVWREKLSLWQITSKLIQAIPCAATCRYFDYKRTLLGSNYGCEDSDHIINFSDNTISQSSPTCSISVSKRSQAARSTYFVLWSAS